MNKHTPEDWKSDGVLNGLYDRWDQYNGLLAALVCCKNALGTYLMSVEDGKDDDAESAYQFACRVIKKTTGE